MLVSANIMSERYQLAGRAAKSFAGKQGIM
jgi:hypothetical protein